MAVFLVNSCKFNGCGLTFATLSELIQHIEETHIDNDPRILEKQENQPPQSLALSYVLRVFTDVARKEKRPRPSSVSPVSSMRSTTPTGSEFDEEEMHTDDDDSDDSWTTQEEFTSDLILSMMANGAKESEGDKPFPCPVPGCKKRYKNINGIKYHAKHGHKKEVRVKKPFKCKCGKSYKTASGLRNHSLSHHSTAEILNMINNSKTVKGKGLQTSLTPTQLGPATQTFTATIPQAILTQAAAAVQQHVQQMAGQKTTLAPIAISNISSVPSSVTSPIAGMTAIPVSQVAMTTPAAMTPNQAAMSVGSSPPSHLTLTTKPPSSLTMAIPVTVTKITPTSLSPSAAAAITAKVQEAVAKASAATMCT